MKSAACTACEVNGNACWHLAFGLQFADISVKSHFADGAKCGGRYFKLYPCAGFWHKKTFLVQVWQEAAAGFAVRVGNPVPRYRPLSGKLTNS